MSGTAFGVEEVLELLEREPMTTAEMARDLFLTPATIESTLEYLLSTGRVVSSRDGLYRLEDGLLARRRRLHERQAVAL